MPDLDSSTTLCAFCPNLCRHACPVSEAEPREPLVPRAKMALLGRLRAREVEATDENVAPLYACTGCGACTEACRHQVEPARALLVGRAEVATRSLESLPAPLRDLRERVAARGEQAARAMREGLPPSRFPGEAQVAFLPSCEAPGEARAMVALLSRLGADYLAVADVTSVCAGYPLLAAGFGDAFRVHAHALARQLDGYARVAVGCAACAYTMKNDYPQHGVTLRPEILHVAELLGPFADKLSSLQEGRERQPAAFYHDPCFLGRRSGVYEAPRRLLGRVVSELREFSRSRADAVCCGGGGLVPETMPETAEAMADARLVEVKEAGLDRVVTACPTCAARLSRGGVTALSLVEVLDAATR